MYEKFFFFLLENFGFFNTLIHEKNYKKQLHFSWRFFLTQNIWRWKNGKHVTSHIRLFIYSSGSWIKSQFSTNLDTMLSMVAENIWLYKKKSKKPFSVATAANHKMANENSAAIHFFSKFEGEKKLFRTIWIIGTS